MRTRRAVPTATLTLALLSCGGGERPDEPVAPIAKPKIKIAPMVDVADPYARPPGGGESPVVALNKGSAPPANQRPGSGENTAPPSASATATGYEIKFATGSPVPTPVVHQGKLIVSGGFNSREIYAYNATTGDSAWGKALSDDGPSNPVCEGNTCVFNSESCTTFAVDARSGKVKWSWWLGDPQTSSPTIAHGLVFASYPASAYMHGLSEIASGTEGGYTGKPVQKQTLPSGATHVIAAFELETGKPVWRRWLDADVMSSPVAVDEFVYLTTFAGTVMKLDQKTGDIRYAISMRATSAPVVVRQGGRESLHVTRRVEERPDETKEAIVRADLGDTRLTFRAHAKMAPYLDGAVQGRSEYAKIAKIDDGENGFASTPAAANAGVAGSMVGVASVSTMQRFQGSRVLVAGNLVFSTMGDEVIAVDGETGETRWRHALDGNLKTAGGHLGTAPLLAGGEIVVATLTGTIVRLDAKTGKLNATYRTGAPLRSQPAVQDGWIYLGTEDGRLIAINTGDRKLTGWPTWGGDNGRTAVRSL
ncbi:MAG: PQQ-binding-like beta-propeller repeat protein [Kofleriaceae bacterium]